jgi:hypothetical protein
MENTQKKAIEIIDVISRATQTTFKEYDTVISILDLALNNAQQNNIGKIANRLKRKDDFYEPRKLINQSLLNIKQAAREARTSPIIDEDQLKNILHLHTDDEHFEFMYKMNVKNSTQELLAIIIINALQYAADHEIDIESAIECKNKLKAINKRKIDSELYETQQKR